MSRFYSDTVPVFPHSSTCTCVSPITYILTGYVAL